MARNEPTREQINQIANVTGYDISGVPSDILSSIDIDTMLEYRTDITEEISTMPGARKLADLVEPTYKQRKLIYFKTGYDVRGVSAAYMDRDRASWLIGKILGGESVEEYLSQLPGANLVDKAGHDRAIRYAKFAELYDKAHAAGMKAGQEAIPDPMVVVQPSNPLDDNSPPSNVWVVNEGVCGFAWVVISDGRSSLAKWMKSQHNASKHYYGGVSFHIHQFNQSYERKMAYARAFASVFKDAGYDVYAGGRLD